MSHEIRFEDQHNTMDVGFAETSAKLPTDMDEERQTMEVTFPDPDGIMQVGFDSQTQTMDVEMAEVHVIGGGDVQVKLEETQDGVIITVKDSTGTESATVKNGEKGEDGLSPVVDLTETAEGVAIAVKDAEDVKTATVRNGRDGDPGYTPVKGKDYQDGKDGVSPVVELTETAEGVEIAITDADGTETAIVRHGKDGRDGKDGLPGERGETGPAGPQGERGLQGIQGVPGEQGPQGIQGPAGETGPQGIQGPAGKDGQPGERGPAGEPGQPGTDGISPVVTVQDITGGHRVTITDKDGAKTFDVMDGKNGTGGIGAQVQADWAVNDPDSPAYVRNRTHYEILPEFEPIHWDGNMTGRLALDLSMIGYPSGQYFVKVSDMVPLAEDLIDGEITCIFQETGDIRVLKIDAGNIDNASFPGCILLDDLVNVVYDADTLSKALGIPSGIYTNGIYFFMAEESFYVSSMEPKSKREFKKIDQKYLPDAVQPDWSQYDETKPDFVKNRTHYEVPTTYDITWDGDMTGRTVIDLATIGVDGGYLVKVSDRVYTKEELVGKTVFGTTGASNTITTVGELENLFPGTFVYGAYEFAVLYDADALCSAFGVPAGFVTNGTYFLCVPTYEIYIKALGAIGYVSKLDEKYLPDVTLRKYNLETGADLDCTIGYEWAEGAVDWSDGSPWSETLAHIPGNIISTYVSIGQEGSNTSYVHKCVFVMNSDSEPIGICCVEDRNLGIVQVLIKVDMFMKRVLVAAKKLSI